MMFQRVLIANRGEIACRVIRSLRRLGIRSIAVYSEADRNAQHVLQADEAWPIGGAAPADSYLRGEVILKVAEKSGAEAIHPGYGFLSENTDFARACTDADIVFIGPRPESIETMGSKAEAKALMHRHAVPLVPGYHGAEQDPETLVEAAHKTGFPLMIKAAAGGGGKGMRIVRKESEFGDALGAARREAQGAFGDERVILERYIEHPRHIEFQVFGDSHGNIIHLNERECSAQRRYQKVLEEAPSPFLDVERRKAMGEAAVAAAKAVKYVGAGTVEFIVDREGAFFFMEMNTRLQVEHPVTEMTLGLDLVDWQLRVAAGEALPLTQDDIRSQGHAIEVRLYAEDPEQNFLPGSGRLELLALPEATAHVRIDGGVAEGDTVTIHYDPMIAKLIVHDEDRPRALARLRQALADCAIIGPKSNIGFLERLVRHPTVVEGRIDTGYLDRHLDEFLADEAEPQAELLAAAACVILLDEERAVGAGATAEDPHSPWAFADGWRPGHLGRRMIALCSGDHRHEIEARGSGGSYKLMVGDREIDAAGACIDDGYLHLRLDGRALRLRAAITSTRLRIHDKDGVRHLYDRASAFAFETNETAGGDRVVAPMPGRIVLLKVETGTEVAEGEELLVMEAMKMELSLKAPRAGTIERVNAAAGDFVDADAILVTFAEQ